MRGGRAGGRCPGSGTRSCRRPPRGRRRAGRLPTASPSASQRTRAVWPAIRAASVDSSASVLSRSDSSSPLQPPSGSATKRTKARTATTAIPSSRADQPVARGRARPDHGRVRRRSGLPAPHPLARLLDELLDLLVGLAARRQPDVLPVDLDEHRLEPALAAELVDVASPAGCGRADAAPTGPRAAPRRGSSARVRRRRETGARAGSTLWRRALKNHTMSRATEAIRMRRAVDTEIPSTRTTYSAVVAAALSEP